MTITCSVLTQIGAQEENCERKNVHFCCLLKLFGCFFLLSNVNGTREIKRSISGFHLVRKKAFYRSFSIKSMGANNNTTKLKGRAKFLKLALVQKLRARLLKEVGRR